MRFNTALLNITILIVSVAMSSTAPVPGLSGLFSIFGGINGGAYGNNPGLYGGVVGYGGSAGPYGVAGGGGGALGYPPYGGYPIYPYSGAYGGAYNPYYGNIGGYGYTYPTPVYG